ncbi:MAG: hypothetical protein AB7O59_14125 [Pirellulales bacterium]
MSEAATLAPVMPAKLRATYSVSPERMHVCYRPRSWGVTLFLIVWLTGWTAGCVFLAFEAIKNPQPFTFLFAVPFWSSWLFVAAVLVGAFTRRQDLEIDADGLRYVDRALVRLAHRSIPRHEFRGFEFGRRERRHDDSVTTESGLEIRSLGQPLFVFSGLPDAELSWLAWQLSRLVESLGSGGDARPSARAEVPAPPGEQGAPSVPLLLGDEVLEAPSDCSWELVSEIQSLAFIQRGRWSWAAVLGLLFICAFWNGIVSVFVANLFGLAPGNAPAGGEWWFLFFFLIPFEAIGLLFLLGLVFTILEPVRRKIWHFDAGKIECSWSWLGIGPRWTYPVEALARVDLVRAESTTKRSLRAKNTSSSGIEEPQFGLSLVRGDNTQLCVIQPLTEGEARWMADAVMRQWPEWFR